MSINSIESYNYGYMIFVPFSSLPQMSVSVGATLMLALFKALAHYTQNCKKCSDLPYTLQIFVPTATIFRTVLYIGNDFHILKKESLLFFV